MKKFMKHGLLIAILLTMWFNLFGQSNEVKKIRRLYEETQNNKDTYSKLSQDDFENSSEGGDLTIYRDSNETRLIEAIYYGHLGNAKYEYYCVNDNVYFVYIEEFNYNAPPTEPDYDQEETIKEETRYYFWNDQMIRWIKPNDEYAEPGSREFKEESNRISKRAVEMLKMVSKACNKR